MNVKFFEKNDYTIQYDNKIVSTIQRPTKEFENSLIKGSNPNIMVESNLGWTAPLIYALIKNNDYDKLKTGIEYGMNTNYNHRFLGTPLYYASHILPRTQTNDDIISLLEETGSKSLKDTNTFSEYEENYNDSSNINWFE